jgi:hypothetical protein
MADTTSKGLQGLSHFKNSRVSTSLWEPIYQNLWTVEITLPSSLGADAEQINLLLEGVKKVSGLNTSKAISAMTQNYKSSDRSFAGAGPDNTYIDVQLDFDVNLMRDSNNAPTMTQVKLLRKWCDLVYDPLTGRMGLKADYTAPQVVITMHDKALNPFWQWTLYNVFPTTSLPAPNLDYSQKSEPYRVTGFTLRCDYWNEVML